MQLLALILYAFTIICCAHGMDSIRWDNNPINTLDKIEGSAGVVFNGPAICSIGNLVKIYSKLIATFNDCSKFANKCETHTYQISIPEVQYHKESAAGSMGSVSAQVIIQYQERNAKDNNYKWENLSIATYQPGETSFVMLDIQHNKFGQTKYSPYKFGTVIKQPIRLMPDVYAVRIVVVLKLTGNDISDYDDNRIDAMCIEISKLIAIDVSSYEFDDLDPDGSYLYSEWNHTDKRKNKQTTTETVDVVTDNEHTAANLTESLDLQLVNEIKMLEKKLLSLENDARIHEYESKAIEKWSTKDVICFILSVDDGFFRQYEPQLSTNLLKMQITGKHLVDFKRRDIAVHLLIAGVTNINDAEHLCSKITALIPMPQDLKIIICLIFLLVVVLFIIIFQMYRINF